MFQVRSKPRLPFYFFPIIVGLLGLKLVAFLCSLTWALVHSYDKTDVQRGLQLCLAMLSGEGSNKRELLYLKAVGEFRARHHLSARQTLKDLLSQYPDFRQAQTLLDAVEQEVVKDGLIGLGAGAAIVGLVAGIAVAASRRR